MKSPKSIYNKLSESIAGNEAAKKAASLILFNTISGRRSCSLFTGPTGSGKTEIFRELKQMFPETVFIADATYLSPEGWNTSTGTHIADIVRNNNIDGSAPAVLVLDEADKIFKPAVGAGGTDYNAIIQNNFLKICDGDTIEFGDKNKGSYWILDARKMSVVFLGAFSELHHNKTNRRPIGFGSEPVADTPKEITADDLIYYGVKPELAGRINRIINIDPPTVQTMETITRKVLRKIGREYGCKIKASPEHIRSIAEAAIGSGLGARYIRTQVLEEIDRLQFECPLSHIYNIGEEKDCLI